MPALFSKQAIVHSNLSGHFSLKMPFLPCLLFLERLFANFFLSHLCSNSVPAFIGVSGRPLAFPQVLAPRASFSVAVLVNELLRDVHFPHRFFGRHNGLLDNYYLLGVDLGFLWHKSFFQVSSSAQCGGNMVAVKARHRLTGNASNRSCKILVPLLALRVPADRSCLHNALGGAH